MSNPKEGLPPVLEVESIASMRFTAENLEYGSRFL
jgi:hypothetical protein